MTSVFDIDHTVGIDRRSDIIIPLRDVCDRGIGIEQRDRLRGLLDAGDIGRYLLPDLREQIVFERKQPALGIYYLVLEFFKLSGRITLGAGQSLASRPVPGHEILK